MNESSACPDPEVLAAFVDGRLPEEDRRRVVVHLDACEACYEVFSETVRFQGEEESRGRVVTSRRFGSRRWHWPAAAAAALVLLTALPILRMEPERPVVATLPGGEAAPSAEALVGAIDGADGEALAAALRRGRPGGALGFGPERVSVETASFRTGVWLVDLAAAARVRDAEAAQDVVRELTATLETAGLAPELEGRLAEAAEAAREGRVDDLAGAAPEIEARAHELLEPMPLAFGKWAEAGRLAAAQGSGGFFLSTPFTGFQHELNGAELPAGIPEILAQIRARSGDRDLDAADLEALEALFRELVARY